MGENSKNRNKAFFRKMFRSKSNEKQKSQIDSQNRSRSAIV